MAVNGTRNGHTGEQLVGRVLSVNEKGLRLEGRSGWLNFSKWAEAIGAPAVGGLATVTLDKDGFVRTVAPAEDGDFAAGGNVRGAAKDQTITRLAVLKAAATFAATRGELKSADVLKIAASWERWITRSEDRPC
jgi:hypothetical protein